MARHGFFNGVSDFFGDVGRARHAASLYNELSQLSDTGLQKRGLRREDIASHCFNTAFGE